MEDASRLIDIHTHMGGSEAGRRRGFEVLNKSSVIFLAAAWEAFVEDVATQAIDHLIAKAKDHLSIPLSVRKATAKQIKEHKHELSPWDLAGEGWKANVLKYRDTVIKEEISKFNTPKPYNVDKLFSRVLGIDNLSDNWNWQGMSKKSSKEKLRKFIEMRGAIAHRGKLPQKITKTYVTGHRDFIARLSVRSANILRKKVKDLSGTPPWRKVLYYGFS